MNIYFNENLRFHLAKLLYMMWLLSRTAIGNVHDTCLRHTHLVDPGVIGHFVSVQPQKPRGGLRCGGLGATVKREADVSGAGAQLSDSQNG